MQSAPARRTTASSLEAEQTGPIGEPPILAEAVEELSAESGARNIGIRIVTRVNHYCLGGRPDESLLCWLGPKIVFQQPQPIPDICSNAAAVK